MTLVAQVAMTAHLVGLTVQFGDILANLAIFKTLMMSIALLDETHVRCAKVYTATV